MPYDFPAAIRELINQKMASGKKEIEDMFKEIGLASPFSRSNTDELGRLRRKRRLGIGEE